jgi:hypothetical protein
MPTLRQLRTEELLVRTRLGFTVCGAPLSIVGLGFGAEERSRGMEVMSGGARLSREANLASGRGGEKSSRLLDKRSRV